MVALQQGGFPGPVESLGVREGVRGHEDNQRPGGGGRGRAGV